MSEVNRSADELCFQVGSYDLGKKDDRTPIGSDYVRVVAPDGRIMMDIRLLKDGTGVEITGVMATKVRGVMRDHLLQIHPRAANCIHVRTSLYDDR